METQTSSRQTTSSKEDFLPIQGTDYIEFYVGNAKQAAHYYKTAFGFQSVGYAGLETGLKDRASYVIRQGKITLVLTSPLNSKSPISEHIKKHGDGVKIIAFLVDDAQKSFEETVRRGAKVYQEPMVETDDNGTVKRAGIYTYGETVHMFVERRNYSGIFLPGFEKWESEYNPSEIGLKYVDHCVGNVELGQMNTWA
ncbi:MAG TPA: VOC family protein, partial [Bacteroidia bacterium]|nr:VOC family protein [Bacteroidia bacterium]